jgi:Flp pilus assembly pilin Flp
MLLLRDDRGQATAEYALVIVAAAVIATALIVWASGSGVLPEFFDAVIRRVRGAVETAG